VSAFQITDTITFSYLLSCYKLVLKSTAVRHQITLHCGVSNHIHQLTDAVFGKTSCCDAVVVRQHMVRSTNIKA